MAAAYILMVAWDSPTPCEHCRKKSLGSKVQIPLFLSMQSHFGGGSYPWRQAETDNLAHFNLSSLGAKSEEAGPKWAGGQKCRISTASPPTCVNLVYQWTIKSFKGDWQLFHFHSLRSGGEVIQKLHWPENCPLLHSTAVIFCEMNDKCDVVIIFWWGGLRPSWQDKWWWNRAFESGSSNTTTICAFF